MVEHDSIIPPGRVGKITPEVKISGMHAGPFKKSITVISNAKNKPDLRVSIGATIKTIIDLSTRYVHLKAEPFKLTLSTEKKDLKVVDVVFQKRGGGAPDWQASLPVHIDHTLKRDEKPKKDGYYDYELNLSLKSPPDNGEHGEFVIRTNHAEKDELTLRGMISADAK